MRVCLIHPNATAPPYGLMSIATVLEGEGHEVSIVNLKDDVSNLKDFDCEVYGFSVATMSGIKTACEATRVLVENGHCVVWGGVHASMYPEQVIKELGVDCVIVGEGEESFLRFVNGERNDDKIIRSVGCLRELPDYAWHLINVEDYIIKRPNGRKSITIVESRGCPYSCLRGDTIINTVEGDIPIKDLVGKKKIGVYTYDRKSQKVFISDATHIRKTDINKQLVRVNFDDGTFIECTPDHKFLTFKNGNQFVDVRETIKEAQDLKPKDSVRALKFTIHPVGYVDVVWGRRKRVKQHRVVMEYLQGRNLKKSEVVHHKDKNKSNNLPSNLQYCANHKEHLKLHPEVSERMKKNNPQKYCTKESYEKTRAKTTGLKRSLESRMKYRESKLGSNNPMWKSDDELENKRQHKSSRIKEINHKVVSVEFIDSDDVYCMEVPETNWFFANNVLVHNCSFCYVPTMFGRNWRGKDYASIMNDLCYLKDKFGITHFDFLDDLPFGGSKNLMFEFCDLMKFLDVRWTADYRLNLVTEELVNKMKECGCKHLFFGVESGSQDMLSMMNKTGITPELIIEKLKLCNKIGIGSQAGLMGGLIGETRKDLRETFKVVVRSKATIMKLRNFIPYPGTKMYEQAKELGFKPPTSIEGWEEISNYSAFKFNFSKNVPTLNYKFTNFVLSWFSIWRSFVFWIKHKDMFNLPIAVLDVLPNKLRRPVIKLAQKVLKVIRK